LEILDFNKAKIPKKIMRRLEQMIDDNLAFVGFDDTFNFTCSKCNNCCKHHPGEDGFTIPHLWPYDIIRLSRFLKTTTIKFVERYAEFGQYDWPPIISPVLKFIGDAHEMRCPFLNESGCSVHEDKPLICRLYPLGLFHIGDKALIVSHKSLKFCPGESGQKQTVRQWLNESGTLYYSRHEKLFDIISSMDIEKFNSLPQKDQDSFYATLYDIDHILVKLGGDGLSDPAEEIVDVSFDFCKIFLKEFGCLDESESEDEGKDYFLAK